MEQEQSDRIDALKDVLPGQAETDYSRKERNAKMYFIKRDPATLSVPATRIVPFLSDIPLITEYGKARLSQQLGVVRKGRSSALTTPLLHEGETLASFAQDIESRLLSKIEDPVLASFEADFVKKCSPASVMYPYSKRKSQVEAYFTDPGGSATDEQIALACDIVMDYVGLSKSGRLRPLSLENAALRLPSATQWGIPYVVHGIERMTATEEGKFAESIGKDVKDVIAFWDHRPYYMQLAAELAADLNHPAWMDPCMMGWRGDLGKPTKEDPIGTKQRVVWMYPHAQSILESMYYPVLTEYLKGKPGFAAWLSEGDTRERLSQFVSQLQNEKGRKLAWSYDAIAFDTGLCERLIRGVSRNIIQPQFQEGTRALLDKLSEYSMTCSIVTPEGMPTGRHFNRPSGSGGTNLLDCFENMVGFTVAALEVGYTREELTQLFKEVMGDDAVYEVNSDFSVPKMAEALKRLVGSRVHDDEKTDLTDQKLTFCKRLYTSELHGVASVARVLLKAAVYERPTPKGWSQYMTEVRWIDQLGMLTGHPLFTLAIDYVVERAPLKLGLALEGGVEQLLSSATDIAWKEAAKTPDQVLDAEDRTLDAELGQARASGRAQVIDYLIQYRSQ